MPINTFNTESDYTQHILSTTESEVSLIKDNYVVKYDGVNVRVQCPKFGDALYLDTSTEINGSYDKYFIDGASLKSDLLPNHLIPVGVVFAVENNTVSIVYYNGYNDEDVKAPIVSAFVFEVSATINTQEHSIEFIQRQTDDSAITIGTFTHSCSSYEQFSQELDTWLRQHPGGSAVSGDIEYDWHCEYMENYAGVLRPHIICDNVQNSRQYHNDSIINEAASDAILGMNMTSKIPVYFKECLRNSGAHSRFIGANYNKLHEILYETDLFIIDETVPVSANTDYIVSKEQFDESEYCADLRAAYTTFEDYIQSIMMTYSTLKSGLGVEHGKSLTWSNALATLKHHTLDGSEVYTFPVHAWCHNINFNSDGLRESEWHLPNIAEAFELYNTLTYDLEGITIENCDQLNKTIEQMHGAHIGNTYSFWTTSLRARNTIWICGCSQGMISRDFFHKKFKAVAITTVTL